MGTGVKQRRTCQQIPLVATKECQGGNRGHPLEDVLVLPEEVAAAGENAAGVGGESDEVAGQVWSVYTHSVGRVLAQESALMG